MKKELVIPLRRLLACAAVAIVATAGFGAAATLGMANRIGAGSTTVGRCDDGLITVDYTGDPGPVTGLTVSGLSATCGLGTLRASVRDAGGAVLTSGTATVPGGGGSASV